MKNKQQKEACEFFNKDAESWLSSKATQAFDDRLNTIRQRNEYVLQVVEARGGTARILDVGCGAGELVHELAKKGLSATGCDFAEEMIALAKKIAEKKRYARAEFVCCSAFDMEIRAESFDVLSANGFIEYISPKQFDQFLILAKRGLKKGGSLVFSSRNRLFNILTLNEFTQYEMKAGALEALTGEAIELSRGIGPDKLTRLKTVPLPRMKSNPLRTGVDVSIRLQYTPAQIAKMLQKRGFHVVEFSPIHIHAVPPRFKEKYPEVHGKLANLLQSFEKEKALFMPYASTFMTHAKKR